MDTTAETPTYDVIEYLKTTQLDWNNTIRICPIKYGQVIKVYDGDTITIATPLFNGDEVPHIETYRFNIRLRGINTPELRTKNNQKEMAIESRLSGFAGHG
jgi:endonuclease YncB( thermonuclease family)